MTHPLHPVDLPLAIQIGLDLLAPHLNRAAGPSLVLGGPDRLRATAALWLDPPAGPSGSEPPGRVLWLAEADDPAPIRTSSSIGTSRAGARPLPGDGCHDPHPSLRPHPSPLPLGEGTRLERSAPVGPAFNLQPSTFNPLEGTPLAVDAVVGVLVPGPLAALRARVRGQRAPFPTVAAVERQLRAGGLTVALRWSIGGPVALWWAALSIAAARADRPDLADRTGIAYRRSLAPRSGAGWAERLALLAQARGR